MKRPAPVIAFTCGDPAGVGPETVVALLKKGPLSGLCSPVLVGEPSVWRRAGWRPGLAPVADTGLGLPPPRFGRASADGGRSSFSAVRLAVRLAARGAVAGVVTAPVSKKAWEMAGVGFRDHTGFLERATGRPARMVLAAPARGLWTITVTRHIPLAAVARSLDRAETAACARALDGALRLLGPGRAWFSAERRSGRRVRFPAGRPRLGLCALNPHGGEEGLMGREEGRVLAPAVRAARKAGVSLQGPIPADAAWRMHCAGTLDGLVCLYHDQAMAPLKAVAGLELVNWTVGIPFPRVSPGHGTAFDIAGKGRADPMPTLAAARLVARLATTSPTFPDR